MLWEHKGRVSSALGECGQGRLPGTYMSLVLRDGEAPANRRRKGRKFKEEDPVCVKS